MFEIYPKDMVIVSTTFLYVDKFSISFTECIYELRLILNKSSIVSQHIINCLQTFFLKALLVWYLSSFKAVSLAVSQLTIETIPQLSKYTN
jgi:hypothetical protein